MRFLNWLTEDEGWKALAALVYLWICLFDMVVIPSWIGLTRKSVDEAMVNFPEGADMVVQLEYLKILTYHHSPYTLQSGGLFHLAFGAILTGAAVFHNRLKIPK